MSAKKSLIILLRIVFILSSLLVMKDAFFKWDGYSYYVRFTDFLPDLSLVFIMYTLLWALLAFTIWLCFFSIVKIIPKFSVIISYEYLTTCFILGVLFLTIKQIFLKQFSLMDLTGFNYSTNLIIVGILLATIVLLLHKYTEKILFAIDARITPLVWIFSFILIISFPLSIFKKESFADKSEYRFQVVANNPTETSQEKPPNIILVIMDTLTALDMQLHGYKRPTTPFISEWAKDAIVFNRAYASSNWTTPAMMSIMTGQRPWTHKVWYRAYYNSVDNYKNSLPGVLREQGYNLYSYVQNPYAHPDVLGIGDAFLIKDPDHAFSIPNGLADEISIFFADRPIAAEWISQIRPFNRIIGYFTHSKQHATLKPAELVYNSFLESTTQLQYPFFAWLQLWPPHRPYLPPKPFMGRWGDAEKFNTGWKQEKSGLISVEYPPERQNDVDILRKRYDEFILYSDKQFELFISRLEETIDMSNTIVILTSDHGESFSHGYQEHDGPHLYEPLVHVPLIVKMPQTVNGTAIDMPVEHTDVAPTILELAGITMPEWMEGRSLYPLIEGKVLKPQPVFSMQLIKNRSFGYPIERGSVAVWDKDYKLIYYLENEKTLLFNVRSDPDETLNLSQEKPEIRQKFLKLINDNLSAANAEIVEYNAMEF